MPRPHPGQTELRGDSHFLFLDCRSLNVDELDRLLVLHEPAGRGDDQAKAETLFRGMFERKSANVSKGRFAQALASQVQDKKAEIEAPGYILAAIKHVCV